MVHRGEGGAACPKLCYDDRIHFGRRSFDLLQNMRVLVLDDDAGVRAAIGTILRREGHEVIAVEDGAAGLQQFATSSVDLAIVDIFLRGLLNGHDIMMSLRERVPTLPMIAISGSAALDALAAYPDLTNVQCLPKPFRPEDLMRAVEAVTGRP